MLHLDHAVFALHLLFPAHIGSLVSLSCMYVPLLLSVLSPYSVSKAISVSMQRQAIDSLPEDFSALQSEIAALRTEVSSCNVFV